MDRLKDKVALVSGAASGIGNATALRFAQEGATVVGFDVNEGGEAWQAVASCAKGSDFLTGDVTREAAVISAVERAVEKFGRIDVLVNAAGVSSYGATTDVDEAEWDRVMNINLKGSFLFAKHAAKSMLQQGSGSIVHIASIEGMVGLNGQITYGTSKGAVIQMTRNMAADFAKSGIRVNCVCPGAIETPLTAALQDESMRAMKQQMEEAHLMGRFGEADEIANAILFLASDEASFITGHPLVVDGGWTAGTLLSL
ncbi:MAG: SDR family oxidoreductase [Halioglobus sp.]|nr:SDR family oxidoreductase [Halioglobus sp.]